MAAAHHRGAEDVCGSMEARGVEFRETIFLPLRKTDVQIEMSGGVTSTRVTQVFDNLTRYKLETVYLFPLPAGATITDMEVRVGERVIRSEVMPRGRAKQTYEYAKADGRKAALLEQERPNMFTTSVANLLPGESVRVCFTYLDRAVFCEGKYSLTFPMVVAPRYVPDGGGVTDVQRITAPLKKPSATSDHRVELRVCISGIPVERVTSNTHGITFKKVRGRGQQFEVTLRDRLAMPDSDFDIDIHLERHASPTLTFVAARGTGKRAPNHGLLSVFPPLENDGELDTRPRDVIFVIDTSGSMKGESIDQARSGLERCLGMLSERDSFAIVQFANTYSWYAPDLHRATRDNLDGARRYVANMRAGGGTEMQPALRYALGIPGREEAVRMVVFLTDGAVGNEESLVRLLDSDLGDARVFAFGIGSAPNEFLLRKMAETGRGQARFIHSFSDIAAEISDLFRTLDQPVLTDIRLAWKDAEGGLVKKVNSYPKRCPDVFHGRPLEVVAKLPRKFTEGSIELTGKVGGETVTYRYPIESGHTTSEEQGGIASLFGRAKIDDLMQQRYLSKDGHQRGLLAEQITRLGVDYQLVTEFTSRVAVDRRGDRMPERRAARAAALPQPAQPAVVAPRRVSVPVQPARGSRPSSGAPSQQVSAADPRLSFPRPMFVGTPLQVRLPNLERPGAPRLSLKAPPEAVLLNRGKEVTSSNRGLLIGG
ncbi:MAG: VIT domain-containing protein, partial [Verrucomicrobiales bacterium]